jgi:hypothetical protein
MRFYHGGNANELIHPKEITRICSGRNAHTLSVVMDMLFAVSNDAGLIEQKVNVNCDI